MKIQMPERVDIFAFVTADLAGLIAAFGGLGARTVNRATPGPLEEAMAFHEPQHRPIGRPGPQFGLLFD